MMDAPKIIKYPRTPHLQGSRLQAGDEDLRQIPFDSIRGIPLVVEEKCDGANCAISFGADGGLLLQSRGHYLTGGYRERHYDLLKQWATAHQNTLRSVLRGRYVMYGEWLYAKHTVFYNALPHYFVEFDVLDRERGVFLDTPARRALLCGLPIASAPVLTQGIFHTLGALTAHIGRSRFIAGDPIASLREACLEAGENVDAIVAQTDPTPAMEGLYIKVERNGTVAERMKYVRATYLQGVAMSETHWLNRPIIPNRLTLPLDALFAPTLPHDGREAPHA